MTALLVSVLVLAQVPPEGADPQGAPVIRPLPGVFDGGSQTELYPPNQQPEPNPQAYPTPLEPLPFNPAETDGGQPRHQALAVSGSSEGPAVHGGLELALSLFPSGPPGGQQDLLFNATPMLAFTVGDDFGLEAGAELRLRVFDNPPDNRAADYGGALRKEDWDEGSDFGQLLRLLRIGKLGSNVWVRMGPVTTKTLGLGHLINRYGNRDNPNYHPAAGNAGVTLGPVSAELFVSDLFGARIFAGSVGVEFGQIFSKDPKWADRFHLVLSIAHDAATAGANQLAVPGNAKTPATLMHLDFDAVLYRGATARVMALTGVGTRFGGASGVELGLAADADLDGFLLGGKLEARKQAASFRQSYFGPGYELSRYASTGFTGIPLAEVSTTEQLPDAFSFYGELRVGSRDSAVFEAMVEHFTWGRTDVDLTLSLNVWRQRIIGTARFTALAMGVQPRYSTSSELRVRLFTSFYLLGGGGTVFTPQPDGTLVRGWFGSLGAGVDFDKSL